MKMFILQSIDAQFALGEIIDNDYQRKEKILEICTQIRKVLENDEGLQDVLTKEFGIEILDLNYIFKEIYDSECPIVVAGVYADFKNKKNDIVEQIENKNHHFQLQRIITK